jgi:hypothetical protein
MIVEALLALELPELRHLLRKLALHLEHVGELARLTC